MARAVLESQFVKLNRQKEHWDRLATEDPLWAILTDPARIPAATKEKLQLILGKYLK